MQTARGRQLTERRDRLRVRYVYWRDKRKRSMRRSVMLKYLRPRLAQANAELVKYTASLGTPAMRNARIAIRNGVFAFSSPTGGTAKPGLEAAAAGRSARVAATGKYVTINPGLLAFLAEATSTGRVLVNCVVNGDHPYEDQGPGYWIHYAGNGVDLDLTSSVSVSRLEAIAARHGGAKNSESSHHHFTFGR